MIVTSNAISKGRGLFKYLKQIQTFLEQNPEEFVILKVRGEGKNLKGFCKNIVANKIVEMFGDKMINGADMDNWFQIENVTMGQIRESKKSLLVMVDDQFFKGHLVFKGDQYYESLEISVSQLREKGIFNKKKLMLDQKFRSDNLQDLTKKINDSFKKVDPTRLRVSQYIFFFEKKFNLKYLLRPPTINKLEENQFQSNHGAMSHIVQAIYDKQDINISNAI